ncbi:hypothetical protein G7Y89_g9714 [Cudoniella acicularis]|uniref:Tail specific protease domain-containing protein n=1 Tax=Cudoniella acicularis TaxID=354080 RepID=A0A8H4RE52_9HELO|nr:hypothetical protein G7Y89_g9714 [Cudoniella acicularis]
MPSTNSILRLAIAVGVSDLPAISATLAYDCLRSVPINVTAAAGLINLYLPYLQFQSTLGWLKSPPPSYQQPATDIVGGFNDILTKVQSEQFTNEYDFEAAIQSLVTTAHDGHFGISLPLFKSFAFVAPWSFVTLSADGSALPGIYVAQDFFKISASTTSLPWNASAVTQVNGQNPVDFFSAYASKYAFGQIEPNGDWNLLFENPTRTVIGNVATFGNTGFFPDDLTLNLTFANGTSVSGEWTAKAEVNLTGVTSGQDFYNLQVAPSESSNSSTATAATSPKAKTQWGAPYPSPVAVQKDLGIGGYFTGYFLNETSIAVISLPSFDMDGAFALSFQQSLTAFLAECKTAGMKKLIIDVQSNGGGTVALGFDFFKQLFPTLVPFGGSQLHAIPALDAIGSTLFQSSPAFQESIQSRESPFSPFGNLDENLQAFTSWDEMFGPVSQNGDFVTTTLRNNFSDVDVTEAGSGFGIVISGYGNNSVVAPQYFQAEDILLLTDGYCASTCTVFAESLKTIAGVKQLALGGRPVTGLMQSVSGVRGSQVYAIASIAQTAVEVIQLNASAAAVLPPISDPPIAIDPAKSEFNIRNQIRKGSENVPLQFTYQAADCRLFYTGAMLADYTVLWQAAADAIWGNTTLCVQGSTGHPSAGNVTWVNAPNATTPGSLSTTGTTTNSTGTGTGSSASPTATQKSAAEGLAAAWSSLVLGGALAFAVMLL